MFCICLRLCVWLCWYLLCVCCVGVCMFACTHIRIPTLRQVSESLSAPFSLLFLALQRYLALDRGLEAPVFKNRLVISLIRTASSTWSLSNMIALSIHWILKHAFCWTARILSQASKNHFVLIPYPKPGKQESLYLTIVSWARQTRNTGFDYRILSQANENHYIFYRILSQANKNHCILPPYPEPGKRESFDFTAVSWARRTRMIYLNTVSWEPGKRESLYSTTVSCARQTRITPFYNRILSQAGKPGSQHFTTVSWATERRR